MKNCISRSIVAAFLICVMHSSWAAEPTADKGAAKQKKTERAPKPERPKAGEQETTGKNSAKPDLKAEFKEQAETLQKKQKELVTQLRKANAEERALIREQLVTLKDNWKELNRDYRDKLDDLKEKVDREKDRDERGAARPRK